MECTQRLECTQDLCSTQTDRIFPEQIGYLGICGTKYPVIRGPNKVGRDPQACNIVLNLNSVSRQHAVINILNKKDFMLMDLDSANKTKLIDKTLQPYIPHPLKNGDTVQFGQVFGIFRLLEDDNDLPMTQCMDIPETPVASKFMSRLNNGTVTTVPESPDVSDRDDSFIMPSQPKANSVLKISNNNFVKPSDNFVAIQPVGSKRIDNVYWKSSKRSSSFMHSDDSSNSFNDSTISAKSNERILNQNKDTIFELETQVPDLMKNGAENIDVIHTADTQIPNNNVPSIHCLNTQVLDNEDNIPVKQKAIHNLDTQVPDMPSLNLSPNIHSLETQIPGSEINNHSPVDVNKQSIFNLETQIPENDPKKQTREGDEDSDDIFDAQTQVIPLDNVDLDKSISIVNNIAEDQKIIFGDLNTQSLEEDFASQTLLPIEVGKETETLQKVLKDSSIPKTENTKVVLEGDINILPTQIIPSKNDDEDLTDCEDDDLECGKSNLKINSKTEELPQHEDLSNLPTQVIPSEKNDDVDFQDMLTQVIDEDVGKNQDDQFGDLLTQKVEEADDPSYSKPKTVNKQNEKCDKTGKPRPHEDSPFKVPFSINKSKKTIKPIETQQKKKDNDDEVYYNDTQDLFEDLCSQKHVEDEQIAAISKKSIAVDLNSDNQFITKIEINSSKTDGVNLIDIDVASLKKVPSDSSIPSDVETTPKKIKPLKFMNIDLPNSQEIKTSVSLTSKLIVSESSSESETEPQDSEDNTPILFKRKKRGKVDAKIDLTKKFEMDSLPTRIITRQRKPTAKAQESTEQAQLAKNILKSKLIPEQEEIDTEIINENISRLRSRGKHSKTENGKRSAEKQEKEIKQKEKIAVKIEDKVPKEEPKKTRVKKEKKEEKKERESIKKYFDKFENKEVNDKNDTNAAKSIAEDIDTNTTRSVRTRRRKNDSQKEEINITKSTNKHDKKEDDATNVKKETKKDPKPQDSATTRRKRKAVPIDDSSPEKESEIRRSKRQRNVKEKLKPILKRDSVRREQSTVYNLSSESGIDSPKNPKQSFSGELEVLSAKRSRSVASSSNSSIQSTPARVGKTQYVLFTAFPCEEVRFKLEKLGAIVVTDVTKCTVLLTLQIKRTFKLLCAVGLGVPIVGPSWVQACADTNTLVDPWQYVMRDESAEKRFNFSLEKTLKGKRNFLKGYNVSTTTNVMPAAAEMKLIVECSGGVWKDVGPNWICVSCIADKPLWPGLRRKGATVVSTEFILGGVLRQKADVQANLFK